jgi:hypothetical protein
MSNTYDPTLEIKGVHNWSIPLCFQSFRLIGISIFASKNTIFLTDSTKHVVHINVLLPLSLIYSMKKTGITFVPLIRDQWSASVIRVRYRFANQRLRCIYSFCPFTIHFCDGIRDVSRDERFFTDADSHWHVSSRQNASKEIKYFINFERKYWKAHKYSVEEPISIWCTNDRLKKSTSGFRLLKCSYSKA